MCVCVSEWVNAESNTGESRNYIIRFEEPTKTAVGSRERWKRQKWPKIERQHEHDGRDILTHWDRSGLQRQSVALFILFFSSSWAHVRTYLALWLVWLSVSVCARCVRVSGHWTRWYACRIKQKTENYEWPVITRFDGFEWTAKTTRRNRKTCAHNSVSQVNLLLLLWFLPIHSLRSSSSEETTNDPNGHYTRRWRAFDSTNFDKKRENQMAFACHSLDNWYSWMRDAVQTPNENRQRTPSLNLGKFQIH